MKFNKDLLPKEIEYGEAKRIVFRKECEPEFEAYYQRYITFFPNHSPMADKGFDYYSWKLTQRMSVIRELTNSVPEESYRHCDDEVYLKNDDIYFVIHCPCGNEISVSEVGGDKVLCLDCGRIYRSALIVKQSDYLHEDGDEKELVS